MKTLDYKIERMLRHESYLKIESNRVRKKMDAFFLTDSEAYSLLIHYYLLLKRELESEKKRRKKIEYINAVFARFSL